MYWKGVSGSQGTEFVSDGVAREFHVLPTTTGTGPRPVFVALTGTDEPETQFLATASFDQLPAQGWTVIAPVRRCVTEGRACDASPPPSADGRTRETWFDGVADTDQTDWADPGPDVRFIERVVRCAATAYDIDQSRIFVGGIGAGATLTNRALTFRSGFFAGGVPASGNWYRIDEADPVAPVGEEIVEGRCCPRPLPEDLGHAINVVIWGGPDDTGPEVGAAPASSEAETKLAANYFASQPDVVTIYCEGNHGHMWPPSPAMTTWIAETLASHPKGTPRHAFTLAPRPAGFECEVRVTPNMPPPAP